MADEPTWPDANDLREMARDVLRMAELLTNKVSAGGSAERWRTIDCLRTAAACLGTAAVSIETAPENKERYAG